MLKVSFILMVIVISLSGCDDKKPEVSAKDHLDLSKLYFSHGAFKASMIEGKNALKLEPNNPLTLASVATTQLKLNDINSANYLINRAISLAPNNEDIKLIKAKILILQRKKTLSKKLFDSINSEKVKKTAEYNNLFGDLKLLLKQPNKAKKSYLRTLKLNDKNITALLGAAKSSLLLKQTKEVEKYTDLAIKTSPNNVPALIWKTQILMLKHQYDEAEDTISRAMVELEQHDTLTINKYTAFDLLAKALMAQGKIDESFKYSNYLAKTRAGKIQASYKNALSLLSDEKDINEAEKAFHDLLSQVPTHASSGTILGLINYKKGDYELADEYLSKFINSESSSLRNTKILIYTKIKLHKYDAAISIATTAIKQHKKDSELHALLGQSYLKQKQLDDSITAFKAAIAISPRKASYHAHLSHAYLQYKKLNLAKQSAQKALQLSPKSSHAKIAIINFYLTKKMYKQAERNIDKWLAKEPNNIVPLNLSATLMSNTNRGAKAIQLYELIASLDPFNPVANLNLVRLDVQRGNLPAAFKKLQSLINNKPEDMFALSLLHDVSEKTKTIDQAEGLLASIIAIHKNIINPRLLLARLNLKNKKPTSAIPILDRVIELDNLNVNAYLLKASALLALNNKDGAIETYLTLAQRNKSNPIGFTQLSRISHQNKEYKLAAEYAQKAIAIDKNYIPAHISLGIASISISDKVLALSAIDAIREKSPNSSISYEMQGDLSSKTENYKDAIKYYKKAWAIKKTAVLANKFKTTYTKLSDNNLRLSAWEELSKLNTDIKTQLIFSTILYNDGKILEAQKTLEKQLKHHPNNTILLNNLANLYLETNDMRALQLAKKALSLNSNNPAIQDTLGWIYAKQYKDYKKAIPLLQQAFDLSANQSIKEHLIYALTKDGKTDQIKRLN